MSKETKYFTVKALRRNADNTDWETATERVEVSVDWDQLAIDVGGDAIQNKGRKSSVAAGAVRAKVVK